MDNIVEQAISVPFRFTPAGSVETTIDQNKIWADRVLSIIGTNVGERMHAHSLGTTLYEEVFATVSEAEIKIPEAITNAFAAWLPKLTLDRVETNHDEYTNQLFIKVLYKLPNDQDAQLAVGSVIINSNSPIKEI